MTEIDSVLSDLGRRLDSGEKPVSIATPSLGHVSVAYYEDDGETYAFVDFTLPKGWLVDATTINGDAVGVLKSFVRKVPNA